MTIKVKHVILVLIILSILCALYMFFKEHVKELLIRNKLEKKVVKYLSFDESLDLNDGTIYDYDYYKNYYNEPYIDISPLIESYIKQVETNNRNLYNSGGLAVELTSNIERTIEGGDYTYVSYLYYGENRKLLIDELEKVLIHKGDDKYSGWCIRKDSPETIDLPYNFYLKYEPSDYKMLNNVKNIIECKFIDSVLEYSYNDRKRAKIVYIDNNDERQIIDDIIFVNNSDKMNFSIGLSGIYYKITRNAKIELHNHYSDKIAEEWQRIHEDDFDDVYWDWERDDCKAIVDKFR